MTKLTPRWRMAPAMFAVGAALALGACGSDDDGSAGATTAAETTAAVSIDYRPIQDYLYDHTQRLVDDTATLQRDAEAYHALAEESGFDYEQLLATRRAEVARLVRALQRDL